MGQWGRSFVAFLVSPLVLFYLLLCGMRKLYYMSFLITVSYIKNMMHKKTPR